MGNDDLISPRPRPRLEIRHIELGDANDFVALHHRHHKPVVGHRFSLAAIDLADSNRLCGVCIVGRPVARNTNFHETIEVTRLCTDGTYNACSLLYGAAARASKELGYARIQTFILDSESGTTLKASGWKKGHTTAGGEGWQSRENRRADQPTVPKTLWFKEFR